VPTGGGWPRSFIVPPFLLALISCKPSINLDDRADLSGEILGSKILVGLRNAQPVDVRFWHLADIETRKETTSVCNLGTVTASRGRTVQIISIATVRRRFGSQIIRLSNEPRLGLVLLGRS